MPRLGYKGRRGTGVFEADVRLTDYAHASLANVDANKISKKAVNAAAKTIRETRHWFDCDEDDFIEDLPLSGAGDQSDGDDESMVAEQGSRFRRKTLASFAPTESNKVSCIGYPIDLWFLISLYIQPEDVGRFALICRHSYNVTHCCSFWRHLYKRFYDIKLTNNVPESFRPLALTRLYGLRTRVIKALYCTYGHFMKRTRINSGVSLSTAAVAKLYRGTCESTWWEHQQEGVGGKSVWKFYFKFRGRQLLSQSSRRPYRRQRSTSDNTTLDYLDDTWANLDDDCCILKVTCHQYTQIPTILGWHLSDLNISLCSDMRNHRLRMVFSESACRSSSVKANGAKEIALLDSVQAVAVFDWWHPSYPTTVL